MKLRLKDIAENIGGKLIGADVEVNSISRDSRDIGKGCLYVPIKGANFDGHDFIEAVCKAGAVAVLSERADENYSVPAIIVKNTRLALGDIARYYRKSIKGLKVIAITGSVGKTTTKDMVYSVVAQKYRAIKTQENYNNDIGVPLTLFNANEDTEVAVVEMGMNHFNENDYLSSVALPDIGLITNVGVSHIENLGSRDGILKAKCEIFNYMAEDSLKILNGDDDKLITVKDKYKNICYCGLSEGSDVYADNIVKKGLNGIGCHIHIQGRTIQVFIPYPGEHMVRNALYAAAVGCKLGISDEKIKLGIEGFEPSSNRMERFETDKYTVVNDVYNANPQSVMASIDALSGVNRVKCCILGDMFELGEAAPQYHREVGEYADSMGIDCIVCIGELSENMFKGAGKRAVYFKTKEEFIEKMDSIIPDGAAVLVKASRGMHFEKIIEKLRSEK